MLPFGTPDITGLLLDFYTLGINGYMQLFHELMYASPSSIIIQVNKCITQFTFQQVWVLCGGVDECMGLAIVTHLHYSVITKPYTYNSVVGSIAI